MPIKPQKILLVGVLPPPVHGQSLATQMLFEADLTPLEKITVGIHSSSSLSEVGRFSLKKALSLFPLVCQTWSTWLRHRPTVLYYTAGSGAWIPFIRDLAFLGLCRPLFRRTLIHYHSGNLADFISQSPFRNALARVIYGRGAWTIRLGEHCPAPVFPNNRVFDVPNGLDYPPDLPLRSTSAAFRILFLGNLFEDKGVIDLLDAVHALALKHSAPIVLSLIGGWPDDATRHRVEQKISALPSNVSCPAPAPTFGANKWHALATHDVFAFPSYYRAENLPLVIIEAMAAGLPVIASDWRGIRSLVKDRVTGLLVPPRDVPSLTAALESLASDPSLRESLGAQAHRYYQQHLTASQHLDSMRAILLAASA